LSGYAAVPDGEDFPCFDGTPAAGTLPPGKKSVKKTAKSRDTTPSTSWWQQLPQFSTSLRPWKKWASRQVNRFAYFIERQTQTNTGIFMLFVVGQLFALLLIRLVRILMGEKHVEPEEPIPAVSARKRRPIDGGGLD
jgi:hypothetical protein